MQNFSSQKSSPYGSQNRTDSDRKLPPCNPPRAEAEEVTNEAASNESGTGSDADSGHEPHQSTSQPEPDSPSRQLFEERGQADILFTEAKDSEAHGAAMDISVTERSLFVDHEARYLVLQQENLVLKHHLVKQQDYFKKSLQAAGLRPVAEDLTLSPDTWTTDGSNAAQSPPPSQAGRRTVREPTLNRDNESPTTASKPQYLYDNPLDRLRQMIINVLLTRCLVAKILRDWPLMEKHAMQAVD
ncbi:MAG: hypothetical protein Q9217_004333, partial [Psora testacea]